MNKKSAWGICCVLLGLSLVVTIGGIVRLKFFNSISFTLFPSTDIRVESVSDQWEGGHSQIDLEYRNTAKFSYTLKPGFKYPYAGFKLYLSDSASGGNDLSGFDSIHVRLTMDNSDAVRLFLKSFDPTLTDTSNPNTYRYYEKEYRPGKTGKVASFSLNDFTVPAWWKIQHDVPEVEREDRFRAVNHIEILNGLSTSPYNQETVTGQLSSITLTGQNRLVKAAIQIFAALMWLLTLGALLLLTAMKWAESNMLKGVRTKALSAYTKVNLKSDDEERLERLVTYMAQNYFVSDITIDILAHQTGIQRKDASLLIRKYLDTNFKGYLNQLRLNEASRLLKETDKQVTEIAISVGYKNISHFSRTFRERFGVSPKEFRSKGKKESVAKEPAPID